MHNDKIYIPIEDECNCLKKECDCLAKPKEEIMMDEKEEYMVVDENHIPIATGMTIEVACLLMEAMFDKFYNDDTMELTLTRMKRTTGEGRE